MANKHRPDETAKTPAVPTVLTWFADRGVPDAAVTLLVVLLGSFTLVPYLGGRTIGILGKDAVTIPTVSEALFWVLAILPPAAWVFMLADLRRAALRDRLRLIGMALGLVLVAVTLHSAVLSFGLTAVSENYHRVLRPPVWYASLGRYPEKDLYYYFRTTPIDLDISPGCALRVDEIELAASGWVQFDDEFGMIDLHIYGGTGALLPPTPTRNNGQGAMIVQSGVRQEVAQEPAEVQLKAQAVPRVPRRSSNGGRWPVKYGVKFDFGTRKASGAADTDTLAIEKPVEAQDLHVRRGEKATLQLIGWTYDNQNGFYEIIEPLVRVRGRQHCGIGALWR
jgi:hypothetical protein